MLVTRPTLTRKFVVAFNRDRDYYQVPIALHEAGLLETLVTDLYCSNRGVAKLLPYFQLGHRSDPELPPKRVTSLTRLAAYQLFQKVLRLQSRAIFDRVDCSISKAAAKAAQKTNSDLLLYSQYAREAFTTPALADRRKGLFVFHPNYKLVRHILAEDRKRYPQVKWSLDQEASQQRNQYQSRTEEECSLAHFAICASSFTKRSLTHQGMASHNVAVVPYGSGRKLQDLQNKKRGSETRFLFVGQGIQRKGIHHLIAAWRRLNPRHAVLRLVCSRLDPALTASLDHHSIRISSAVSRKELDALFAESHVFVMPSLAEGFGLVYLEALAAGCHVIGTTNTGLPDLDVTTHQATTLEAGNQEQLAYAIEAAHDMKMSDQIDFAGIQTFARSKCWSAFRKSTVEKLAEFCR